MPSKIESYVTPRRLVLVAEGVPAAQADVSEERRGPRVGAPPQAVEGFLKSAGIASLNECEERDTGKGVFYFAIIKRAGKPTAEVLPELLRAAMLDLPWPKSMRFPAASFRWVRPLVSVICLFDGKVLPLPLDGVPTGDTTRGHRFLSKEPFAVRDFADYRKKLRDARVMLRSEDRRQAITLALYEKAAEARLTVKDDPGLLDEVSGLVEWPVVLMGAIDPRFMPLPPEVLTTSMRAHQKYFACLDASGKLAPRFLVVANMAAADGGKTIVAGNERVLRARLSDAEFFWEQDRKVPLSSRVPKLKERRLLREARHHGGQGDAPRGARRRARALRARRSRRGGAQAAFLAKADLSTGMVGEFPELQGVMGRYYALHDGEERGGRRRHRRALLAPRPERQLPDGAGQRRAWRSRTRSTRLVGFLRHRREADRAPRIPSRCAAPRSASSGSSSRTSCACRSPPPSDAPSRSGSGQRTGGLSRSHGGSPRVLRRPPEGPSAREGRASRFDHGGIHPWG